MSQDEAAAYEESACIADEEAVGWQRSARALNEAGDVDRAAAADAAASAARSIASRIRSASRRKLDTGTWLELLYTWSADRKRSPAVEAVLDDFGEWLKAREPSPIDAVLAVADPSRLMVEVSLALLMESFRARHVLPSRAGFFARMDAYLERNESAERREGLLHGLE